MMAQISLRIADDVKKNIDWLRKSVAQMEAAGGTVHEVELDDTAEFSI